MKSTCLISFLFFLLIIALFIAKPNDNEFDLMIDDHGINQQVQPPTVFKPRTEAEGPDHFRDDGSRTLGSIIDSRVKSLSEMGFSEEEAEDALNNCNGDVNEALNLLLSR